MFFDRKKYAGFSEELGTVCLKMRPPVHFPYVP